MIALLCFVASLGAYEIVDEKASLPLLAPDWSERKVEKIRLDNGLEAYLVSDPKTHESGAALTVKVGSWDEPESSQGLAHFLEHMLFLGTAKYPQESEFETYLSAYRGVTNAFTYNDITGYLFSVRNEGFVEALDRFSSFFKEPLFNPSGVNRELKAIDQEWKINSQKDSFLRQQILKELANPKHPFSWFSSGNEASLKNASQDELKRWYQTEYSADRMRLWVLSALPLSELKKVVETDFGGIAKAPRQPKELPDEIFGSNIVGKFLYMEPIQEEETLSILWELPKAISAWDDEKPWTLLCWILGDEGEKSLLAELKREHLATDLSCCEMRLSQEKILFTIAVELTDKGLQEKEKVIERVFQTIERISKEGVSPELFSEIQTLQKLHYQWAERKNVFDDAMDQAFSQGYEPLETYPERGAIATNYAPEKIKALLALLKPEKAIYFLTAPMKKTKLNYPQKERWTSTAYLVAPFDTARYSGLELMPQIQLPQTSRYIPEKLHLKTSFSEQSWNRFPTPKKQFEDAYGELYFFDDAYYGVPQMYGAFEIRTPAVNRASAQCVVLSQLYLKALKDALSQVSYEAKMAGLELEIQEGKEGFEFIFKGYDEKSQTLFDDLLAALSLPQLTQEKFDAFLGQLKRDYKNFQLETPLSQAKEFYDEATYTPYVTEGKKLSAVRNVTYEKFQTFLKRIYAKTYVEGLLAGNLTEKEVESIWKKWHQALKGTPYPKSQHRDKSVIAWKKGGPFSIDRCSKARGSALYLGVEDPEFTFKKRGAQQILHQNLEKDFFAELRTRQQTGYLVGMSAEEDHKVLFDRFYIQSSTHTPQELLWRVETFLENYLQELPANISEERFKALKASLIAQLKERPPSLYDMGEVLKKLAFTYDGDFDWIEKRLAALEDLTYEEFLQLTKERLSRQNRRRLAVEVQGIVPSPFRYTSKGVKPHANVH